MNQHFAASWLQSLSGKLESLTEWSWAKNKQDSCTTHRNLFREFFSAPFQKTLALVDERKKGEFLSIIEKNLYKFDDGTQQFPLGCLCALLQHGKDSPKTQEKVAAWVDFLLERLRGGLRLGHAVVLEVVEECLSAPFLKFVPLMEERLQERLADGLGEHLGKLDENNQKRVLDNLPAIPTRVESLVVSCTKEINDWLLKAPRFPATPVALADTLTKMEHPLVKFFTAVKDPSKKESFLVAVALAVQGLRTRFRWMCAVEPDLEALGGELQRRLFTVEGQGPVMEMWLSSRLKKYNGEVANRTAQLAAGDPMKYEQLRARLQQHFPERPAPGTAQASDPEAGWIQLDGPTVLADALLGWLTESCPGFFCPQHCVARETVMGVLQRFGRVFETDPRCTRARLALAPSFREGSEVPQSTPPLKISFPVQPALTNAPSPGSSSVSPALPMVMPAPLVSPGTSVRPTTTTPSAIPTQTLQIPRVSVPTPEVSNLVDLLLNEALEGIPPEARSKIAKVGHGVYRFGTKEATLHTTNGRLFVYRVGEVVRQVPVQTLLQEEGFLVEPAAAAVATAAVPGGAAVDLSSVAKIALQSKQISTGMTTTTATTQQSTLLPFGLSRPSEPKTDPQALMSKRVEAATKAMDVSKQIVRRSINFEDDKLLRKLLTKGIKYDKQWLTAYQEYCASRGVAEADPKNQSKEFVATFIERNMPTSINQDWAKKIIYSDKDKKDKKEKKDKDKKKKDKEKKRKASESSSSNGGDAVVTEKQSSSQLAIAGGTLGGGSIGLVSSTSHGAAVGQAPGVAPGAMELPPMPPPMPMYGAGLPMGMGGMMAPSIGLGAMVGVGPMSLPMSLPDTSGMPGISMETGDEHRARKKAKKNEKANKAKK